MAERRMFAKTIIDSDAFLDMPLSTQALYFHLSMRADDDGFINNPKKIQRMVGASEDDLKLLVLKKFIIPFESGIVVIKHWKIHNYIQKDRYKETVYKDEKALLEIKDNNAYTLGIPECIQPVSNVDTQVRLGKDRLGKDSIGEGIGDSSEPPAAKPPRSRFTPPTIEEVKAYCKERGNSVDPERFVDYYTANGWVVGKNKMKDWEAAVRTWEKREAENPPIQRYGKKPVPMGCGELGEAEMEAIRRTLHAPDVMPDPDPELEDKAKAFRKRLEEMGCV
jgi:hypothetical protein